MTKLFHVYVNGKLLMSKASAAKAYGFAEFHMSQRRSVWVTSQYVRD